MLQTIRRNQNGADLRLGQMAYYVESLEVAAELLGGQNRNREQ